MSAASNDLPTIHVAVGILENASGEILVQQRDDGPFAGLWEFPGGKVEPGEPASAALARELAEEIGVTVTASRPLMRVRHTYRDRRVLLDTHIVTAYRGEAQGLEGQRTRWLARAALFNADMLPADWPIVLAINLPAECHVLEKTGSVDESVARARAALSRGARLLVIDEALAAATAFHALIAAARSEGDVCCLVRGEPGGLQKAAFAGNADGVVIPAGGLPQLGDASQMLVAVECDSAQALAKAGADGVHLALLRDADGVDECNVPVYLDLSRQVSLEDAWRAGAQGLVRRGGAQDS